MNASSRSGEASRSRSSEPASISEMKKASVEVSTITQLRGWL